MNSSKSNFRYFSEVDTSESKSEAPRRKIKRTHPTKTRTKSLKKQIRDTQRLLFKKILNEDALSAQQKKLETLKKAQLEENRMKIRSKRVKKYRGVKYFDSKKVLRKLSTLTKSIGGHLSDIDNQDEQDSEVNQYKRYLNYITYFPKEKKYLSIFPNSERLDPGAQNHIDSLISEINSKVKQGLFADAWDAHLVKTSTAPSPTFLQSTPSEESLPTEMEMKAPDSPTIMNNDPAPPDFIPIEGVRTVSSAKKKHPSKKLLKTQNLRTVFDPSKVLAPPCNNAIPQTEFEENLKNDNFFFLDNRGSEIDTSLFNRRPQRRNFQDNRDQRGAPMISKQKPKFRQLKNKKR